jgi:uncharacterized protein YciI
MFIVHIEYKKALADVDALLPAHLLFLDEYYKKGVFVLSGRCEPRTGGIILSTIKSAGELEEIMKKDPFYADGAASFEIIEFKPTMAAPELQLLIGR